MTIVEFLQARIAEDEAAAEQLTHIFHGPGTQMYVAESWIQSPLKKSRFLAECAAKRSLMELYEDDWEMHSQLASVYADHPDYRQEWA